MLAVPYIHRLQQHLLKVVVQQIGGEAPWKCIPCRMSHQTGANSVKSGRLAAVCQFTATPDKSENFQTCKMLIEKAHKRGAQMIFLPECFDYVGESREQSISMAEPIDGDTICKYRNLAKTLGTWLSLGGFHQQGPPEDRQRVSNTHLVINSNGDIVTQYCKTHLFDVDIKGKVRLKETDFTIPGNEVMPPVQTPVGKVGLATCYDLRFPELSISLTQQGAEILTFPSAFTQTTGLAHWEVLLRSRAIENQCYVLAAAQTGKHHAKRTSYGHAMIVDPWGAVIAQCHEGTDVCIAEIDLQYLQKVRLEMPVQEHRRTDLYGTIVVKSKVPVDSQFSYQFGQHMISSSVVFFRSALSIAFVNRKPVLPGHILVCPLRCVERFNDLTPAETADLFQAVQDISKVVQEEYSAASLTIAVQDGAEAGQTVRHVHVHILPRHKGDFDNNDDVYELLEHHDKTVAGTELDDSSKFRSQEEMAEESMKLRQYFK